MIAALYVETGGAYFGLPDVDPWDEARDARLYTGPWPVVAHPPCSRWCQLAPLNEHLYGYRVGDDGGTFASALGAVREFGGVLEHPAYSLAWSHFGLPAPQRNGWVRSFFDEGWTTAVDQAAYGCAARKRTWLYYVGDAPPCALDWREVAGTARVSDLDRPRGASQGEDWTRGLQGAESSRTPLAFRDALLGLAAGARVSQGVTTPIS